MIRKYNSDVLAFFGETICTFLGMVGITIGTSLIEGQNHKIESIHRGTGINVGVTHEGVYIESELKIGGVGPEPSHKQLNMPKI